MKRLKSSNNEFPQRQEHHIFHTLKWIERFTIRQVYKKSWKKFVRTAGIAKNMEKFFEQYFLEIHTRYYKNIIQKSHFIKVEDLIRGFFLYKANESMRACLTSLNPYNITSFVQAIRTQIETTALLYKFCNDPEYYQNYLKLNEDRDPKKLKELDSVLNIITLVKQLDNTIIPYVDTYNYISSLLHPNPSAIRFYYQPDKTNIENVCSPHISFYFRETVVRTEKIDEWFDQHLWLFLTMMEHYLILFDKLTHTFFIDENEETNSYIFHMSHFVKENEKEILKIMNNNMSMEDKSL